MDTLRTIFDSVGNGFNTAIKYGASVNQSLNREVNEGLRPQTDMDQSAKTMTNFVKFVGLLDMDPIEWKEGVKKKLVEIRDRNVHCTLETAEAMAIDRAQENPMAGVSMGVDSLTYLCAPPQYGKTFGMMFSIWRVAVEHGIATIMFTHGLDGENTRMASAVDGFNERITICAEMFGIDLSDVPLMKMYDSKEKGDDAKFGEACRDGCATEVPFYILMGNNSGVKKAKHLVENYMSMNVDRDEPDTVDAYGDVINRGRMLAQVVVDEADKFIQPGRRVRVTRDDGTSYMANEAGALETALNTEVLLKKELPVHGDPSRIRNVLYDSEPKECLFDCFTSVLLVTATIQAFLTTEEPIVSRVNHDVIFAKPSRNYWGLMKMDGWDCKIVENMVVRSYRSMVDDMVQDNRGPRHGMVAVTSKATGTMLKASQGEMALAEAKRVKGILSIAWNGNGIIVYSSSPEWSGRLLQSGAFEATRVDDEVVRFESQKANMKKPEWNSEMGVPISDNIHTYPGLIDFIYSIKGESVQIPHTILFSLNMAARGTPIKGWSHCGELTDIYIDIGTGGHDEYLIQLAGRILGIDKRTQEQRKIVWGPRRTLEKLYDAVISLPFFVAKLKEGVSFPKIIGKATREIYDATGVVYKDVHQATTKRTVKRTRAGNEKLVVARNTAFKKAKTETRMRVERVEFENKYQHVPIRQHVPVAQAVPVAAPVSMGASSSSSPTPEQAWNNQKDQISGAMKSVVGESEVPVTLSVMADRIEGECHFADSNGFTMQEFVGTICIRADVLLYTGLKYEEGVFSKNTVSTKERFFTLVSTSGRHVSMSDIKTMDPFLYRDLQRSNNRIQSELVDSGRIKRVSPGVFSLV